MQSFFKVFFLVLIFSFLSCKTVTKSAALKVQNGERVPNGSFEQVVGLYTTAKVYDEKNKTYILQDSTCTGTVFNNQCVVTATHCANKIEKSIEKIKIVKTANIDGPSSTAAEVAKIIYRQGQDLAVVKINQSLPSFRLNDIYDGYLKAGVNVFIIGYGANKAKIIEDSKG